MSSAKRSRGEDDGEYEEEPEWDEDEDEEAAGPSHDGPAPLKRAKSDAGEDDDEFEVVEAVQNIDLSIGGDDAWKRPAVKPFDPKKDRIGKLLRQAQISRGYISLSKHPKQ
jgi:hypothetical protein